MSSPFIDYMLALKRIVKHDATYEWLDKYLANHRDYDSPEYEEKTIRFAEIAEKLMDGFDCGEYQEIGYNNLEDCFIAKTR